MDVQHRWPYLGLELLERFRYKLEEREVGGGGIGFAEDQIITPQVGHQSEVSFGNLQKKAAQYGDRPVEQSDGLAVVVVVSGKHS